MTKRHRRETVDELIEADRETLDTKSRETVRLVNYIKGLGAVVCIYAESAKMSHERVIQAWCGIYT
jgi:hypothetical protein